MSDNHDGLDAGLPIVHAGFIPLTDCAPLVIVKELGLDREHGFSLRLHREVSWSNIRDKLELGIFDCAHLLAPMAFASTLGLGRPPVPVIAPMALNLSGNAITVSLPLYNAMRAADPVSADAGGMACARALSKVVEARRTAGQPLLTLGMVYPFSCHNYDLRLWLASAGVDPDHDVNLIVVPPPLIADALVERHVDAFCVGAPWGMVSVQAGHGRIIATKNELSRNSPEKVLGVRLAWAERMPDLLIALIQSLIKACKWLDEAGNNQEAARLLADARYIGVAEDLIARSISGRLIRGKDEAEVCEPDFISFHRYAANLPRLSHAMWILQQMARWRQMDSLVDTNDVARRVYRADLYRVAASDLGLSESNQGD